MNTLPIVNFPTSFQVNEDSSGNNLTGVSIFDPDSDDILTVEIALEGTLTLASTTGLTFLAGDGTNDNYMVFTGKEADINLALSLLKYTPFANDDDGDVLSITVSDGSQTPTGPGTFPSTMTLNALTTADVVKFSGIDPGDNSGLSVSNPGDVNGDGIDDFIIGAGQADPNGTNSGEAYVVFGVAGGFTGNVNLSTLNGTNGFKLNGKSANDNAGFSVGFAGDLNNDGLNDILIGAPGARLGTASIPGEVFVVYGSSSGFGASFDLSSLNGTNGATIIGNNTGTSGGQRLGYSVSGIGDFNDDGFDDFAIGARDGNNAYVIFGSSTGLPSTLSINSLNGTNGFKLEDNGSGTIPRLGFDLSQAGDINGDGIDDLVVTAGTAATNGNANSGAAFVLFGTTSGFNATFDLQFLNGTNGFKLNGPSAGALTRVVEILGDVNGDGIDDLGVAAIGVTRNGNPSSGEAYVIYGSTSGFNASINLGAQTAAQGITIIGPGTGENLYSISSAGDINNDGMDDFIVGAYADSANQQFGGRAFVVFGQSGNFGSTLDLTTLNGTNGFIIDVSGSANESALLGTSVSKAGDVNGDGVDDLLVSAPGFSFGSNFNRGDTYVIYGRATFAASTVNGTFNIDINGTNDAPTFTGDRTFDGQQRQSYVLTIADIGATDPDTNDDLRYDVNTLSNGQIQLNGTTVANFRLSDVVAGNVTFLHADTSANASFAFNLVDSGGSNGNFVINSNSVALFRQDGTNSANTLLGQTDAQGRAGDLMLGLGGNDILRGFDGNDDLRGGDGNDTLKGGTGNDLLFGNAGNDSLDGGDGDDILNGGGGDDTFLASAGADAFNGSGGFDRATYKQATSSVFINLLNESQNAGAALGDRFDDVERIEATDFNDTVRGDNLANTLLGLDGNDVLVGNGGNDTLIGGEGRDNLNGGADNDKLRGDAGNDTLNGSAGNDTLDGGDGNDILNGGNGRDLLIGGAGADTFNGGADFDRVSYKLASSGVTVDMTTTLGSAGEAVGDTFTDIERLEGSQFNDVIAGTSGEDYLLGLDGNDILNGGSGNDRLSGGDGDDQIFGNGGNDLMLADAGADSYNGGGGNNDRVSYKASSTGITINLQDANASTGIAAGDTFVNVEVIEASAFNDRLVGSANDDVLRGMNGTDILTGGLGADELDGGAGADTLVGGGGADTLIGERGADRMTGGSGNDSFLFSGTHGNDTITDFDLNGNDVLVFATASGAASQADLTISQVGNDTRIAYSGGTITLEGVDVADMTASDFMFI